MCSFHQCYTVWASVPCNFLLELFSTDRLVKLSNKLDTWRDPHSAFSALWRGSYRLEVCCCGMTHCKLFPLCQHLLDLMRIQGLSRPQRQPAAPSILSKMANSRKTRAVRDGLKRESFSFSLGSFSTAFHNYRGEAASGKSLAGQVVSSDQFNRCTEATFPPSQGFFFATKLFWPIIFIQLAIINMFCETSRSDQWFSFHYQLEIICFLAASESTGNCWPQNVFFPPKISFKNTLT